MGDVVNRLTEITKDVDVLNLKAAKLQNRITWARTLLRDICDSLPASAPDWLIRDLNEIRSGLK